MFSSRGHYDLGPTTSGLMAVAKSCFLDWKLNGLAEGETMFGSVSTSIELEDDMELTVRSYPPSGRTRSIISIVWSHPDSNRDMTVYLSVDDAEQFIQKVSAVTLAAKVGTFTEQAG
jgi:hypothetical protein